jgi:hypothetical protein
MEIWNGHDLKPFRMDNVNYVMYFLIHCFQSSIIMPHGVNQLGHMAKTCSI